ncbi:DUF6939 family protein [Burkholderia stagnalis]|uniref:DUF6939 family protein n=1 Tax=Burkholderia stagnalis TaxID=1503054 RepID=UPI000AD17877|nr:hypothetical protein [Burkholderia stagnalis]
MPNPALSMPRQDALAVMLDDASAYLMVDSFNGAPANMRPYRFFNPFLCWPEPAIPVPGQPGRLARSVESIWQGLKLVDNRTDFDQLTSVPRKRPTDAERRVLAGYRYRDSCFAYGDRQLDLLDARFLIYLPSYLFVLDKLAPEPLLQALRDHVDHVGPVLFYDWDANQDITDTSASFSHSAILASWFNGSLEEQYFVAARQCLSGADWRIFEARVDALLGRYRDLNRDQS